MPSWSVALGVKVRKTENCFDSSKKTLSYQKKISNTDLFFSYTHTHTHTQTQAQTHYLQKVGWGHLVCAPRMGLSWLSRKFFFGFSALIHLSLCPLPIRKTRLMRHEAVQFSSVQSLSRVWLIATPWITARQASLSITDSRSLLKLMSIESVLPSKHLILCRPLLLLPTIPPSIRVFSNESTLHMRWPKYWSFSFSISPSKEHPGLIFGWNGWISLQSKGLSRVFSNITVQNSPSHASGICELWTSRCSSWF